MRLTLCLLLCALLALGALPGCGDEPAPKPKPVVGPPPEVDTAPRRIVRRDLVEAVWTPAFRSVAETLEAGPDEAVLEATVGTQGHAYPIAQIAYHTAVNDTVAERPVVVVFHPLTGDAWIHARGGTPAETFGVLGYEPRDVLLYDKRTQSMWRASTGTCIDGFRAGETLAKVEGAALALTNLQALKQRGKRRPVLRPVPEFALRYFRAPHVEGTGRGTLPPGLTGPPPKPLPEERFRAAPDLFPTLDRPTPVAAGAAAHTDDADEVLGVSIGGAHRAYPAYLLAYHHGINDVLGGVPVLVTFCTVCSEGNAYDTRVGTPRRTLQFDFDGILDGLPVFADRQTRSRWMHLTARAFDGWYAGTHLAPIGQTRYTTWGEWKRAHPDTTIADRSIAAFPGDYNVKRDSYRGQPFVPELMRPTMQPPDPRLPPNTLCAGLVDSTAALAVPFAQIEQAKHVLRIAWAGAPLLLVLHPASKSLVAFRPRTEPKGEAVTLRWKDESGDPVLRDDESGSRWDLTGTAIDGPRKGATIPRIPVTQVEWYGWAAVHPETSVRAP